MTHEQFRERAARMGMNTPADVARNLGLDGGGVHRMWTGRRPISKRTEQLLEQASSVLPRGLTPQEVRVLTEGVESTETGAHVRAPYPRSNFDMAILWGEIFEGLRAAGLLRYVKGTWWLTKRGSQAAAFLTRKRSAA